MACCCCAGKDNVSYLLFRFSDLVRRGTSTRQSSKSPSFAAAANNLTRIFEELKCPICFNVCVPPIHNCVNGHIVCDNCRKKGNVTTCPTCREGLQGARNYFAENFILNYAQQCRYASQGCEHLRLKGCSMKPHEEKCIFRPVKCIVALCGLDIPYKNVLGHLDYAHKASGTNKLPTTVEYKYSPTKKSKKAKWLPYYIQAFGNVYYIMMQRVKKNFWIWAYSQTSKESDELEYNHFAYIKLKHPEKISIFNLKSEFSQKVAHSWHGPVYPIRTPFKEIMNEGCCFMLPEMVIKNFVSEGMLNFTVDIRKKARRSLKDVKLHGDDSDTAVASSIPAEYLRPPSFYEPNLSPDLPPATTPNMPEQEHSVEQNGNSVSSLPKAAKETASRKLRTAAIGIPRGFASVTKTATSSLNSVVTTPTVNLLLDVDNLLVEKTMKNENDIYEKIFLDKISSQVGSIRKN